MVDASASPCIHPWPAVLAITFFVILQSRQKAHKVCDDCGCFGFALHTLMAIRVGNYFFCCTTIKLEKHTRCVTIVDAAASPCIHHGLPCWQLLFLLYYNQSSKKHTKCVTIADTSASPCIHPWLFVLAITFFVVL